MAVQSALRQPAQRAKSAPIDLSHGWCVAAIVCLALIAYGSVIFTPALFGDDWANLELVISNQLSCPDITGGIFLRPLTPCWTIFQYHVLGTNIVAYNALKFGIDVGVAVSLYALMVHVLPKQRLFSLATALVYLVYPTNFTHSWWTIGAGEIAFIFLLLSLLCLAQYYRDYKLPVLVASVLLAILSLETYEATLGLFALGALIAGAIDWRNRLVRLPASPVVVLVLGIYTVGRWFDQLSSTNDFGHPSQSLVLTPAVLVSRLVLDYRVNLQWGWGEALERLFPQLASSGSHSYALASVVLIVGLGLIFTVTRIVESRLLRKYNGLRDQWPTFAPRVSPSRLATVTCGLAIVAAGYVPTIIAYPPDLSFVVSHVNILPSIGGSIVLTSILAILSESGRRNKIGSAITFVILLSPFLVLGTFSQTAAQNEARFSWTEQKTVWHQMFEIAPDFAPNTTILLLMPSANVHSGALAFESGPWSFSKAISILYGHDDLAGYFDYPNQEEIDFGSQSFRYRPTAKTVPYGHTVIFEYDRRSQKLSLVTKAPIDPSASMGGDADLCQTCILHDPPADTMLGLRTLIGE